MPSSFIATGVRTVYMKDGPLSEEAQPPLSDFHFHFTEKNVHTSVAQR